MALLFPKLHTLFLVQPLCFARVYLRLINEVSIYVYLKKITRSPPSLQKWKCALLLSARKEMKTTCALAIKSTPASSKGQFEKRGHADAWTWCWINTLITGELCVRRMGWLAFKCQGFLINIHLKDMWQHQEVTS